MKKLFTLIVAMFAFANLAKATPSYCLTFVNSEIKEKVHETQVFYKLPTPLVKDKNYTLTMRVYFENPFDKGLPFWPYKKGGQTQYVIQYVSQSSFEAGKWTDLVYKFTALDDHEFLQFPIGYVNGTMRIDDVVLVEDGTTTNLVNNGSFEDKVDYITFGNYGHEDQVPNDKWWSWSWAMPTVSWEIYPSPFILGVSGGPLTQDMFHQWNGVDANAEIVGNALCAYNLNNSTDIPYGDVNVYYRNYADISEYSKLVVTCSEGIFRIMLNRKEHPENKGEYLEYSNNVQNSAITVQDNGDGTKSYSLDIDQIRDKYGYVHLNAIKAPWSQKVTVTSMELKPNGKAVDGYRHFSCNKALDFSTVRDIEAYIVPECEDGKVYMKKVTGVVPANTGLILKDVKGASSVTIPGTEPFDSTLVNLLVPVAKETEITKAERGNNYLFDGEKWVAVEEATSLNAGSSYLKASSSYSLLEASYKPLSSKNPDFIDGDAADYDPNNGLAPSDELPGGSIESPTRPENGLVTFPEEDSENADAVGTVTGIDNAQAGKRIARITTVGGAQLSKLQKGVNIVTYSDGSRATVIIK